MSLPPPFSLRRKRGMPLYMQHQLERPEMLRLSAKDFVAIARTNGYGVNAEEMSKIRGFRNRLVSKIGNEIVPKEQRGTIGGLHTWVTMRSREALIARGRFGLHAAYVVGAANQVKRQVQARLWANA